MRSPRSNYLFSQVPSVVRPRSVFDKSRYYKSAFDAGYLIPCFLEEILPGDTMSLNVTAFARLATLVCPFMDNLYLDFFFFFVPNRLVWENWERFCGAQDNPDDSTDYLIPTVDVVSDVGSIFDYFGLPIGTSFDNGLVVNALPFRAYNLIWNECFRDENLQDSVYCPKGDGPDDYGSYNVLRRGKRKSDPFNAALPFPQKGPGVELPIGTTAPVVGTGKGLGFSTGQADSSVFYLQGNTNPTGTAVKHNAFDALGYNSASLQDALSTGGTVNSSVTGFTTDSTKVLGVSTDPAKSGLYADLSSVTAITINALREAFQVQKWYEQLARGGSRYLELCLSMFGTHTGDARLQRPEYLGGGSTPIQIHSVVQASATDSTSPQGNLAGYGVAATNRVGFTKSFVEHGHVIGLCSIRGDYGYQQGLDRLWSRQTKFDFYWPAFAHLGEVPVLNKEIYYQGIDKDNEAFGYQERWYEYRYGINKITGKLRSGISGSLDVWHLAQYFTNLPTLNSTFIQEAPPVGRVVAVQNEPQFIFDSVFRCRMARVMPVYSTPGLVDHF